MEEVLIQRRNLGRSTVNTCIVHSESTQWCLSSLNWITNPQFFSVESWILALLSSTYVSKLQPLLDFVP